MITKTQEVRTLVQQGDLRGALRIAKGFRQGLTQDQRSTLVRAHEAAHSPSFYASLGRDPHELIRAGETLLTTLYGAH